MEYRKFTGLGTELSLLGFGCMRFPKRATDGKIEEVEATQMLETARAAGINYFDTAWGYHGGESEPFLGRVFSTWPRESFYLATKLPTYLVEQLEEAKDFFEAQLQRLQTDYIDFYLLHNLNGPRWRKMVELGVVDYFLEQQKQGRIKHFGFSFHDGYEAFAEILAHHKWDCCQLQLNYMDTEEQAGLRGYRLTEELGVPLIIMEPVKGGALANLPNEITAKFREQHADWSTASWALRWAASLPNVMTVLSGMSTPGQVADNLSTLDGFRPLNEREQQTITETAQLIRSRVNNGCTACRYCMPCPAGVDIPGNFQLWNKLAMYQQREGVAQAWQNELKDEAKAKNCISCGACEKACPQTLEIRRDLAQLQKELDALL